MKRDDWIALGGYSLATVCIGVAAWSAVSGVEGWGWFLFVAVIMIAAAS